MADLLRSPTMVFVLVLAAVATTACSGFDLDLSFNGKDGSGVPETVTVEAESFDEIEVTGVFDVTLTIAEGAPSVEVTVDDNLVSDLDVGVRGDRLRIGFDSGSYDPKVNPTATVTVASIDDIEVSGASSLVAGDLDGDELRIDVSGASTLVASGNARTVSIDASGASDVDLDAFTVSTATVDASGASTVIIGAADVVEGDLSGASSLTAPATATGEVDTSGASSVERN